MNTKMLQRTIVSLVAFAAFGSSLMTNGAYAQNNESQNPVHPVQGLAVFDATGKRVGNVLGSTQGGPAQLMIGFQVSENIVLLGLLKAGFTQNTPFSLWSPLYYESTTCAGTPFVLFPLVNSSDIIPAVVISGDSTILGGSKIYGSHGSPQVILASSSLDDSTCNSFDPLEVADATPLRLIIDLSTQFQPPFTLR